MAFLRQKTTKEKSGEFRVVTSGFLAFISVLDQILINKNMAHFY